MLSVVHRACKSLCNWGHVEFSQLSESRGMVCIPDRSVNAVVPRQIICYVFIQEHETVHPLLGTIDADCGYSTQIPAVHDQLLCFADIEGEIVVLTLSFLSLYYVLFAIWPITVVASAKLFCWSWCRI